MPNNAVMNRLPTIGTHARERKWDETDICRPHGRRMWRPCRASKLHVFERADGWGRVQEHLAPHAGQRPQSLKTLCLHALQRREVIFVVGSKCSQDPLVQKGDQRLI